MNVLIFTLLGIIIGIIFMIFLNKKKYRYTTEQLEYLDLENEKKQIHKEKEDLEKTKETLNNNIIKLKNDKYSVEDEINELKQQVIQLNEEILLQEFGLYTNYYNFQNSTEYINCLNENRDKQKYMLKNDTAATYTLFTLNGSTKQGEKLTKDMVKVTIRSFNSECEYAISKVKFNNIISIEKKINNAYDQINKLGKYTSIYISEEYLQLKIEELYLVYEYQQKKEEEKEEQKRIKQMMKEQEKLIKEIEREEQKIEKEQKHYLNEIQKVNKQLSETKDQLLINDLSKKINELNSKIHELEEREVSLKQRLVNKAGYVYIISNIGSFGENVYKIGVTRRLDPQDRVNELGSASVPFNFDVHAFIFSDDAFALENKLHKAFDNKRVNKVNSRKEFFNVTLDEIEEEVKKNYDKTIEFVKLPIAEEYRLSLKK